MLCNKLLQTQQLRTIIYYLIVSVVRSAGMASLGPLLQFALKGLVRAGFSLGGSTEKASATGVVFGSTQFLVALAFSKPKTERKRERRE